MKTCVSLAFLLGLSACGECPILGEGSGGDGGKGGGGRTMPVNAECGSEGFPCTLGEVSDEVFARTEAIAKEALTVAVRTRSTEAMAKAIAAHDDAILMGTSKVAVRFRVKGGRPTWVFVGSESGRTVGGGPAFVPPVWAGPSGSDDGLPPVGRSRHGQKPTKSALVLSAFKWQWALGTETPDYEDEVREILSTPDDYENGVTYLSNGIASEGGLETLVGVEQFLGWEAYDAIHVSTHGGRVCAKPEGEAGEGKGESKSGDAKSDEPEPDDPDCITAIATGDVWSQGEMTDEDRAELRTMGMEIGYIPLVADAEGGARELGFEPIPNQTETKEGKVLPGDTPWLVGPFVLATSEFFRKVYSKGLNDKIILVSACEGGRQSDLARALTGRHTAVIGWTTTVDVDIAGFAGTCFWKVLLGQEQEESRGEYDMCHAIATTPRKGGRTVEEAFEKVERRLPEMDMPANRPLTIVVDDAGIGDPETGARLEQGGDRKTRGIEIIRLLDKDGDDVLNDRGFVKLVGAPGDGRPDKLEITAELRGLARNEDPSDFLIHLSVDDRRTPTTWKATERIEDGVYRGTKTVELGFDLPAGRRFDLHPWVTYPQGLSRWHYEDIAAEYFWVTVSGPAFATPQRFQIDPEAVKPYWTGGTLLLRFRDARGRTVGSTDGSFLTHFMGAFQFPEPEDPAQYPGDYEIHNNDGHWFDVITQPQGSGCPPDWKGCPRRSLIAETGSFELTEFQLGRAVSRPHAEGRNIAAGTFQWTAHAGKPFQTEMYVLKGAFFLSH